ncbi:hypothetical protein [Paraburkholderia sp.]|uniref:hypothetical protein n=1 Tax=Paraburkholderia sp. TaxID=1926495 RepID=UPI003D6F2C20
MALGTSRKYKIVNCKTIAHSAAVNPALTVAALSLRAVGRIKETFLKEQDWISAVQRMIDFIENNGAIRSDQPS